MNQSLYNAESDTIPVNDLDGESMFTWRRIGNELEEMHDNDSEYANSIKLEFKRNQFLNARKLLRELVGINNVHITYDLNGGPEIVSHPNLCVSLSHSHEMVAASFSKNKRSGIDIQLESNKILHLGQKFVLNPISNIDDPHSLMIEYHLNWSAKEAMFKSYRTGKIDFKHHLSVDLSTEHLSMNKFITKGQLHKMDEIINFDLYCYRWKKYFIVFSIESL